MSVEFDAAEDPLDLEPDEDPLDDAVKAANENMNKAHTLIASDVCPEELDEARWFEFKHPQGPSWWTNVPSGVQPGETFKARVPDFANFPHLWFTGSRYKVDPSSPFTRYIHNPTDKHCRVRDTRSLKGHAQGELYSLQRVKFFRKRSSIRAYGGLLIGRDCCCRRRRVFTEESNKKGPLNCINFLRACFCPCKVFGENVHMTNKSNTAIGACCLYCTCFCFYPVIGCCMREEIHLKLTGKRPAKVVSFWQHLLCHLLCPCLSLAQENRALHEYGRLKAIGAARYDDRVVAAEMSSTIKTMARVSAREGYFWRKTTMGEMRIAIPCEGDLKGDAMSQKNKRERDRKKKLRAMAEATRK